MSAETITALLQYSRTVLQTRLHVSERGASLVEYALLISLLALVCAAAIGFLGCMSRQRFQDVGTTISTGH